MKAFGLGAMVALACVGAAQVDSRYEIRRESVSAEPIFSDSGQLMRAAELLQKGKSGVAQLRREAQGKDAERAQVARIVLLGSGDPSVVPLLLSGLGSKRTGEISVALKTIQVYPAESWPVLVSMSERGNPFAIQSLTTYVKLGQPKLLELTHSPRAEVRATALIYVNRNLPLMKEALSDPSEAVRRQAVQRILMDDAADQNVFLTDPRLEVRVLFAELFQRWSQQDTALWVKLANDPSPRVRKWAMLHLSRIGLSWGHGSWTSDAINAVEHGILHGPPEVRETAILAARGWMLQWDKVPTIWSPDQIAHAREVFRLPAFRDAIYRQAVHDEGLGDVENILDIQVPSAYRALAISGDPRTVALFRKKISERPDVRRHWIAFLAYVPGPATTDLLFDLIEQALRRPHPPALVTDSYEVDQIVGWATGTLRQLGVHDFRRATDLLKSNKISWVYQFSLATCLARTGDATVTSWLARLADNTAATEAMRMRAASTLAESPNPAVPGILKRLSDLPGDPTTGLKGTAIVGLQRWRDHSSKSEGDK